MSELPEWWGELMRQPLLTIDPARQSGDVCAAGTRIPASSLYGPVMAGDSIGGTADDYDCTRQQVLIACWWRVELAWMQRRPTKEDRQVRDRWGHWAEDNFPSLAGYEDAPPCPDPPPFNEVL